MTIDLKKSGGDFLSVNTFPQKLKCPLLDLSVFNISYEKNISIFYSINNGIPLLPPMDLAHAHVQIKYKHTATSPPSSVAPPPLPRQHCPSHRHVVPKRCDPRPPRAGPTHHLLSPTTSTVSRPSHGRLSPVNTA